jgi:hypothetical protein
MPMFAYLRTSAAVGVPYSAPVALSKVSHAGLSTIENLSVS